MNSLLKHNLNLQYKLNVQIQPEKGQIDVSVAIVDCHDRCFYLNNDFDITRISSEGRELVFTRKSEDRLPFTTSTAVCIQGQLSGHLLIEYTGKINHIINQINMIQPYLVELALYAAWYPIFKNTPPFTYELDINLPYGYLTTTNGLLMHQYDEGGIHNSTWKSFDSCTDIVIIASPQLKQFVAEVEGTRIEMFYRNIPQAYISTLNDRLTQAIRYLSDHYGPSKTKGFLRYINSPRDGWGYSRVPLFVVPETYTLQQLEMENGAERIFHGAVHELAHFWWSVSNTASTDDWINEGLAEYSAFRVSREFYGNAFANILSDEYKQHASHTKTGNSIVETTGTSEDRYVNRYEKSTLIFIEAERRFGQQNLDKVCQTLYQQFNQYRNATTESFLCVIRNQLGAAAQVFFKTALYQGTWIDPQALPV